MNTLLLSAGAAAIAAIFAACVNYEALIMVRDRPSRLRTLGVVCGTCGIASMALLPFMPVVALLQWFATDAIAGARITRGIFFVAIASTAGSLVSVCLASWLDRREA